MARVGSLSVRQRADEPHDPIGRRSPRHAPALHAAGDLLPISPAHRLAGVFGVTLIRHRSEAPTPKRAQIREASRSAFKAHVGSVAICAHPNASNRHALATSPRSATVTVPMRINSGTRSCQIAKASDGRSPGGVASVGAGSGSVRLIGRFPGFPRAIFSALGVGGLAIAADCAGRSYQGFWLLPSAAAYFAGSAGIVSHDCQRFDPPSPSAIACHRVVVTVTTRRAR